METKQGINDLSKQSPERRKEIAAMGGKATGVQKLLKELKEKTEGMDTEAEEELLDEARKLFVKQAVKDAAEGDFKKFEWWEKVTGKNKHNHWEDKDETVVSDNKLHITVGFDKDSTEPKE